GFPRDAGPDDRHRGRNRRARHHALPHRRFLRAATVRQGRQLVVAHRAHHGDPPRSHDRRDAARALLPDLQPGSGDEIRAQWSVTMPVVVASWTRGREVEGTVRSRGRGVAGDRTHSAGGSGMRKKMQRGFTLMELMVVIVIVAILAAVAVPLYINYVNDARRTEGRGAIGALVTGANKWYQ